MNLPTKGQPTLHRIVIVEDNLDQLHSLAMLLREMGHTVEFAINGYVAYDVIRRARPDTVICDLGLPGMTGFEVASQVRRDPELSHIRLIALSGYGQPEYQERAKQVGFDLFYTKPLDPVTLHELFHDAKDSFAR